MAGGSDPAHGVAKKLMLFIDAVMCDDVTRRKDRIGEVALAAWEELLKEDSHPDWADYETFADLCDKAEDVMRRDRIWCGSTY